MDLDVMEKRYRKLEADMQKMMPLLADYEAHKAAAGYRQPDPHSASGALARSADIETRCEAALARVDQALARIDGLHREMEAKWASALGVIHRIENAASVLDGLGSARANPLQPVQQQPGQAAPDPYPAPTAHSQSG